jgi:hypothetical protein
MPRSLFAIAPQSRAAAATVVAPNARHRSSLRPEERSPRLLCQNAKDFHAVWIRHDSVIQVIANASAVESGDSGEGNIARRCTDTRLHGDQPGRTFEFLADGRCSCTIATPPFFGGADLSLREVPDLDGAEGSPRQRPFRWHCLRRVLEGAGRSERSDARAGQLRPHSRTSRDSAKSRSICSPMSSSMTSLA